MNNFEIQFAIDKFYIETIFSFDFGMKYMLLDAIGYLKDINNTIYIYIYIVLLISFKYPIATYIYSLIPIKLNSCWIRQ